MTVPGNIDTLLLGGQRGYQIERSLRFNSADSAYLNRTPASAGNRKTWTWSAWVKKSNATTSGTLFAARTAVGATYLTVVMSSAGDFRMESNSETAYPLYKTNALFRDPAAWYHFVVALDMTQATSTDRIKVWVNSVLQTTASYNVPAQNTDLAVNSTETHLIGQQASGNYFDGYLTEIHFIDGQALTPSSFGETDTITGVWKPKKYAGTYTGNSFYLKFADNSGATSTTLGKDSSGLGNHFTPNNFSVTAGAGNDSLIDTPTPYADGGNGRGNYCTWNPIYTIPSNTTTSFTNGNLDFSVTQAEGTGTASAVTTMPLPTTGKWYWEITPTAVATLASTRTQVGVMARATISWAMANIGADNFSYAANGAKANNNVFSAYGNSYTTNDVIGVAVDLDNGAIYFAKNGTWQNSGDPTSGSSKTGAAFTTLTGSKEYFPAVGYWGTFVANFGQRAFAYTPPSGFKALNTQNLPEPSIKKPSSYFDTKLYTGNNGTLTVTGLGFSPDLVWIKNREVAGTGHAIQDTVRGATAYLFSNSTSAENTNTSNNWFRAFTSDGFTVAATTSGGTPTGEWNNNGSGYVAWCWDESATPGFDIVTYTGNATNRTIAHSLGVAPSMMIIKRRDAIDDWGTYHVSLGNTQYLYLDGTQAANTASAVWNNTSPTSSVFSVGTSAVVNANAGTYVAYLWSEVAGFSKFGSYTGNGSSDGSFVFCGFRPKVVWFKRTDSTGSWFIEDSARGTYNAMGPELYANLSDAETTVTRLDFLSNGFKMRAANAGDNASGGTYIFCAWAESPFKYSLAR